MRIRVIKSNPCNFKYWDFDKTTIVDGVEIPTAICPPIALAPVGSIFEIINPCIGEIGSTLYALTFDVYQLWQDRIFCDDSIFLPIKIGRNTQQLAFSKDEYEVVK